MVDSKVTKPRRPRRHYSKQFKAELVAAVVIDGKSVSTLSREHQMNPNLLDRWVREYKRQGRHDLTKMHESVNAAGSWVELSPANGANPSVVASGMTWDQSRQPTTSSATLSVTNHQNVQVNLAWPCNEPATLALFVRGLLT